MNTNIQVNTHSTDGESELNRLLVCQDKKKVTSQQPCKKEEITQTYFFSYHED